MPLTRRLLSAWSVVVLVVLAGQVGAAQAAGEILRLRKVEVVDHQGFGQPVVAYTLLAPIDWQVQGGIQWNIHWRCMSDLVSSHLRLTSPDGSLAFEIFPNYIAQWFDEALSIELQEQALAAGGQACPLQPPFGAGQFLSQMLVPAYRSGAQVFDMEQNPAAARAMAEEIQVTQGAMIQMMNAGFETDAARILVRHGAGEEWLVASVAVVAIPGPSPSAAMAGQMGTQMT